MKHVSCHHGTLNRIQVGRLRSTIPAIGEDSMQVWVRVGIVECPGGPQWERKTRPDIRTYQVLGRQIVHKMAHGREDAGVLAVVAPEQGLVKGAAGRGGHCAPHATLVLLAAGALGVA
eukprot:scaffold552_cov526-Prasinococcus_capsulatus_cf.AAC.23